MFAPLTRTFQGSRAGAANGLLSRLPAQQPAPGGRRRSGPGLPLCGGRPRPAPSAPCRAHVGSQGGSRADAPLPRRLQGGTPAATRRAVQEKPLRSQRGGDGEGAEREGREQRSGSDRGRDRGGEFAFHAPTLMRRRNVGKTQSPQTALPLGLPRFGPVWKRPDGRPDGRPQITARKRQQNNRRDGTQRGYEGRGDRPRLAASDGEKPVSEVLHTLWIAPLAAEVHSNCRRR
jgi:hypothetical protein